MDLIINLNKPGGITSQDATLKAKKILKAKKAGHTGTLDPSAIGVLLLCVNKATRLAPYFSSLNKEYKALMKLGEVTDTQDADGNVTEKYNSIDVGETLIKNTLKSFEGEILQSPPMFSALKYRGRPLYKYAKRGIDIPREPRKVSVYHIKLLNIKLPFVCFRVACSKGTYIRTLCNDIGKKLGIGAHLFELERTAVGTFNISNSLSIEELSTINLDQVHHRGIYTMDMALSWMPDLKIKESFVKSVRNGGPVKINYYPGLPDNLKTAPGIKIKSPRGELLAIGSFLSDKNVVKMDVVFNA